MSSQHLWSATVLADLVRESRLSRGMTQQTLADLSGVRVGTIRDVEQGRTARPRGSTVSAILRVLDVSGWPAADLLPDADGAPGAAPDESDPPPAVRTGPTGLFILGTIAVERDGRRLPVSARVQRHLVVRLALAGGAAVDQDDLFEAVWDRERRPGDEAVLHSAVARLRRVVDPVPIVRVGTGYALEVRPEQLDWLRFRDAVRSAEAAGSAEEAFGLLRAAMAMWRGFPGDLAPWVGTPFELWDVHRQAARLLATSGRAIGRAADAVPHLRNALTVAPYDEAFHAELILSLAASGRRTEALIVYRDVRRALLEEHGVDVGAELVAAHAAVLSDRAGSHVGLVPPRQAPLPPRVFVGRVAEVDRIVGDDVGSRPAVRSGVTVISGPAGVGKTALALEAARRMADRYPDGTLYVDAKGTDRTAMSADAIARRFLRSLGEPDVRGSDDPDEAPSLLRSALAGRRVLVVLDNVRSPELVRALAPAAGESRLVVTSRWSLHQAVADCHVALTVLDLDSATALLTTTIGGMRAIGDRAAAETLAELCGRLPLALAITAARLASRPASSLADMVALLEDEAARLEELATPDSRVDESLEMTYRLLSPAAQRMLRAVSLHRADAFGTEFCLAVLDGIGRRDVYRLLEELVSANVVMEVGDGSYRLHDLLRIFARRKLDEAGELAACEARIDEWYLTSLREAVDAIYPNIVRLRGPGVTNTEMTADDALAWISTEESGLVRTAREAATTPSRRHVAWEVADELRAYCLVRHVDEWKLVVEAGLAAARAAGDLRAESAMLMGRSQQSWAVSPDQGPLADVTEAERLAAKVGWADAVSYCAHNLGWMHAWQGRPDEAEGWYRKALEHSSHLTGPDVGAIVRNAIGLLRFDQGRYAESVEILTEVAEWNEAQGHTGSALTNRGNLARSLRVVGRAGEALDSLEAVLAGFRERGDLRGEASTLDEMAHVLLELGRWDEALEAGTRGHTIAANHRDLRSECHLSCTVAGVLVAGPDPAAAQGWLDRAELLAGHLRSDLLRLRVTAERGRLLGAVGRPDEARDLLRSAGADAEERGLGHLGNLMRAAERDLRAPRES
ncbi:tetratricopeptide repeat protein [Promicromonospora sp. NPDC050880]|uniref:tetratricopeptide repeat protein n=1 Tax=Promicromonospora sp. NPDC050880 TaxID=3364406 RepID=UPI00379B4BD4